MFAIGGNFKLCTAAEDNILGRVWRRHRKRRDTWTLFGSWSLSIQVWVGADSGDRSRYYFGGHVDMFS